MVTFELWSNLLPETKLAIKHLISRHHIDENTVTFAVLLSFHLTVIVKNNTAVVFHHNLLTDFTWFFIITVMLNATPSSSCVARGGNNKAYGCFTSAQLSCSFSYCGLNVLSSCEEWENKIRDMWSVTCFLTELTDNEEKKHPWSFREERGGDGEWCDGNTPQCPWLLLSLWKLSGL